MEDDLNLQKENINIEQIKNDIKENLSKIKKDYENNITNTINIYTLNEHLNEIKLKKTIN